MESPTAAQRVPPMWIGPVGLAETNSRFSVLPERWSFLPYFAPSASTVSTTAAAEAESSTMLMKPGPATSTDLMPSASPSSAANSSARSRGFMPAFLASCMAALDAQSPWARSFGRMTANLACGGMRSVVRVPALPSFTRLLAMLKISSLSASGLIPPSLPCAPTEFAPPTGRAPPYACRGRRRADHGLRRHARHRRSRRLGRHHVVCARPRRRSSPRSTAP